MSRYYPYLTKGELGWKQQKRFFHCLHGTLDLIVNKKIFVHDSSRDYFTREEVFRLFNLYFEYDEETSVLFTNQLLAVKRLLIGGSINRLKDKELSLLYDLIYDYKDAYFIIYKQIPILMQAFAETSYTITPEQRAKSLAQIKKAFKLLASAYKRENITYPIQDIYRYGSYFKQAGFLEDAQKADQSFSFLHNLIEGNVFPEKEIESAQWEDVFTAFYKTIDLLLYYKTYFVEGLSGLESAYIKLESARLFLSLFPTGRNIKGFPLNNLDGMLSILVSFFEERAEGSSNQNIFSNLKNKEIIRLFTRTLACFSLSAWSGAGCASEWRKDSSVVTVSFPDSQFQIFSDKIQRSNPADSSMMFLDPKTIGLLNHWIHNYKTSLFDLHQGAFENVAVHYQLDHWLEPFFEWEEGGQVKFGAFYPSDNKNKTYNLLNYQAFLSLLFSSYLPDSYFINDEKGISFKVWRNMVSQVSPLLVMLGGSEGYKPAWKQSFHDLFNVADSFLNSSNRDQHLSSRELIDLTVHLLSAIQNSQQAFNIVSDFCGSDLDSFCIASAVVKDPDILSAYPRFQKYIFDFKEQAYIEKIQDTLGEIDKEAFTSLQLMPLFFLIQSMEVNYHIIDRDQSFNLESSELFLFAQNFTDSITEQVPYVFNSEQALSYLMYSFKTGNMPFFTGSEFDPVRYTHWHLSSKNSQSFTLTPNDFHFLLFDFYNLYKRF
ncbi:MAG: hypothetical protein OXJ52_06835 [Oligoflexia bacterium]|nr:hypothetical protein [Oligoflexia bacterium]